MWPQPLNIAELSLLGFPNLGVAVLLSHKKDSRTLSQFLRLYSKITNLTESLLNKQKQKPSGFKSLPNK